MILRAYFEWQQKLGVLIAKRLTKYISKNTHNKKVCDLFERLLSWEQCDGEYRSPEDPFGISSAPGSLWESSGSATR